MNISTFVLACLLIDASGRRGQLSPVLLLAAGHVVTAAGPCTVVTRHYMV